MGRRSLVTSALALGISAAFMTAGCTPLILHAARHGTVPTKPKAAPELTPQAKPLAAAALVPLDSPSPSDTPTPSPTPTDATVPACSPRRDHGRYAGRVPATMSQSTVPPSRSGPTERFPRPRQQDPPVEHPSGTGKQPGCSSPQEAIEQAHLPVVTDWPYYCGGPLNP